MQEYKRAYPFFSLCGLNCGLCPRHHTHGASQCPGCGGPDFHLKHPSCAVIPCNKKHDNVDFCFQCSQYPCERYTKQKQVDSFISYQNVITDFAEAKKDLPQYKRALNEKKIILTLLIERYNDGRHKNFFCLAVNLLSVEDLTSIIDQAHTKISTQDLSPKEKATLIAVLFNEYARQKGIVLNLRK